MSEGKRVITESELKSHNSGESLWIAIHDKVYDLTEFQEEHPGGAMALKMVAGEDGTAKFERGQHSEDARELMQKYEIGNLSTGSPETCGTWLNLIQLLIPLGVVALVFSWMRMKK